MAHAGNGFFMRRGYCVLWVAWEGDLLPGDGRMVLDVPVARNDDGSPITGTVRVEYMADVPGITCFPLSGRIAAHSFPTASRDTQQRHADAPPLSLRPAGESSRPTNGSFAAHRMRHRAARPAHRNKPLMPSDHRYLSAGRFQARLDLRTALHRAGSEGDGPRPCRGARRHQLPEIRPRRRQPAARRGEGVCLGPLADRPLPARFRLSRLQRRCAGPARVRWRDAACRRRRAQMAEPSFRQPDRLRRAAIRGSFQHRRQFSVLLRLVARPPDRARGRHPQAAGDRSAGDPHPDSHRILGAPRLAGAHRHAGQRPEAARYGVRVYLLGQFAAFRRSGGRRRPSRGIGQNLSNVVSTSMLFRAMLDAMDRWATDGTPPPASRIPTRADGTLVDIAEWRSSFPAIPGVATPRTPNPLPLLDFGPDAERGILREPPVLVPGGNAPGAPGKTLHRSGAGGGSRRQRRPRRARADGGGAARHLYRLEPARARLRPWHAVSVRGQLHPVRRNRG